MSESFGKCEVCNDKIVIKDLKLRGENKTFLRVYVCKNKIAHTLSQFELEKFDIGYYKKMAHV